MLLKWIVGVVLAISSMGISYAANQPKDVYLVTDPVLDVDKDKVTHCNLYVDGATAPVQVPVVGTVGATGNYCKWLISGLSEGTHTLVASFANVSIFGSYEGPLSTPFSLKKPGSPTGKPTGQSLSN